MPCVVRTCWWLLSTPLCASMVPVEPSPVQVKKPRQSLIGPNRNLFKKTFAKATRISPSSDERRPNTLGEVLTVWDWWENVDRCAELCPRWRDVVQLLFAVLQYLSQVMHVLVRAANCSRIISGTTSTSATRPQAVVKVAPFSRVPSVNSSRLVRKSVRESP